MIIIGNYRAYLLILPHSLPVATAALLHKSMAAKNLEPVSNLQFNSLIKKNSKCWPSALQHPLHLHKIFLNTWLSSCLQILAISVCKLSFTPCKECGSINRFYFCVPHKSQPDSDLERLQYVGLIIVSLESMDPITLCAVTAFSRYKLHELQGNFHNISISYVASLNSCLITTLPHLRETEVIFISSPATNLLDEIFPYSVYCTQYCWQRIFIYKTFGDTYSIKASQMNTPCSTENISHMHWSVL